MFKTSFLQIPRKQEGRKTILQRNVLEKFAFIILMEILRVLLNKNAIFAFSKIRQFYF